MSDQHQTSAGSGRMPAIDLLRGFAIAWVVLFHLWGDLEFFPGVPREYYEQLQYQFTEGRGPWRVFTSALELFFRDGFQGVPLFMMISGISLTVAAHRASGGVNWPRFLAARFRKLLFPYWFGVAITYGVIALIAWRQAAIGDGTFANQFTGGVTISRASLINIDWEVVRASVLLIPRLLDARLFFAPQLALWFVGLLAQYYLLFPLLFVALKRIGLVPFLVVTFAATVAANWWIVREYGAPEFKFYLATGWAPFRLFEFTAGMAIGEMLAGPRRERWLAFVRNPFVIAVVIAAGIAAHTTGDLLIGQWSVRYWQSMALPLMTLGLALMTLPLLTRRPGRIEFSRPARAFATVGVMSYAVLLVNDPMRLVASQLRVEDVSGAVWWTFVVAVYVPASLLLAWPVARLFGLLPKQPALSASTAGDNPPAVDSPSIGADVAVGVQR